MISVDESRLLMEILNRFFWSRRAPVKKVAKLVNNAIKWSKLWASFIKAEKTFHFVAPKTELAF